MKRIILTVVLIVALLMSFVACNGIINSETVYDILNGLSKQSYSKIQLNIITLTDDIELKSSYVLTANQVDYSIEQLNLLTCDGEFSAISEEYKSTISGTATIEDGKITKIDNEAVTVPEYDELKGRFDFKESYFKNSIIANGKFSADVASVSGFLGVDDDLSDVKLVVEYTEGGLKTLTITYNTANSTVTNVYLFEK